MCLAAYLLVVSTLPHRQELQEIKLVSDKVLVVSRAGGVQKYPIPDSARATVIEIARTTAGLRIDLLFSDDSSRQASGDCYFEAFFENDFSDITSAVLAQLWGVNGDALVAKALGKGNCISWTRGHGITKARLVHFGNKVTLDIQNRQWTGRLARVTVYFRPSGVPIDEAESPLDWMIASWKRPSKALMSEIPTFGSVAYDDLVKKRR